MRNKFLSLTLIVCSLSAFAMQPQADAKTVRECNDEYATNKPAIQGSGQKKKDFITDCRAGTETIPGGATAAPAPAAPQAAPAAPQQAAPVAPPQAAPRAQAPRQNTPAPAGLPTAANQFANEAQAKAKCPSGTVVWVNTRSGVYHFAGTRNYGNTKSGAYMCETDANAAGDRAPKNEEHP